MQRMPSALLLSLALIAPAAAYAAAPSIQVMMDQGIVHAAPGSVVFVSATLSNPGSSTVHITGVTSGLTDEYAQPDVFEPFNSFGPDTLGPGESWEGAILKLTIPPTVVASVRSFDLSFMGGAHPFDHQEIGLTFFAVDDSLLTAGVPPTGVATGALRTTPNPFQTDVSVEFVAPIVGPYSVTVLDISGRKVAQLHTGTLSAGPHRFTWDGTGAAHRPEAGGVYFIRVVSGTKVLRTKVLRLR